jgi:hypothetical protein
VPLTYVCFPRPPLPASAVQVRSIVGTLLEVLTTPSESVQRGVSDCLPALMKALSRDSAFVTGTVETLLDRALRGAKYGDRRGAAFGLAGAVRGLGLSCLRGMGVMDALKAAIEDKSSVEAREGASCVLVVCLCFLWGEGEAAGVSCSVEAREGVFVFPVWLLCAVCGGGCKTAGAVTGRDRHGCACCPGTA